PADRAVRDPTWLREPASIEQPEAAGPVDRDPGAIARPGDQRLIFLERADALELSPVRADLPDAPRLAMRLGNRDAEDGGQAGWARTGDLTDARRRPRALRDERDPGAVRREARPHQTSERRRTHE